jgi:hypothetical protein
MAKLAQGSHFLNIDGPDRPNFDYVFSAAVMRTRFEFSIVLNLLNSDLVKLFTNR